MEQQVTSFTFCIQNILLHCDVFIQRHVVCEGGRDLAFLMVYGSWKMFRFKVHLLRRGSNLRSHVLANSVGTVSGLLVGDRGTEV